MNIGSLTLKNKTILAPLAGITNLPHRLLAKEAGCALVCSEMVSANGLVNKSPRTKQLMDSLPEEKPLSVQPLELTLWILILAVRLEKLLKTVLVLPS
jgi:tRNA-dihydrouridine synthase B